MLKPFWRYYGGKYRAAPLYPRPEHDTIIEPFAGAAGYSLRYPDRRVILVEKYPVIAEIWRYLIAVASDEIMRIPEVDHVEDLPSWVPSPARDLVGFCMNSAVTSPRLTLSSGRKRLRALGRRYEGWSTAQRERVASQVERIRHWRVIDGDYSQAPDLEVTWFVDPPYEVAGHHYVHSEIDYPALADWCRERRGQVIVCEAAGAQWLPFVSLGRIKAGSKRYSDEAIWTNREPMGQMIFPCSSQPARTQ